MNNNKIKVSVIMPVYNSGEYLKTAIESILNQSLREIELILVDDGSTDGSSERCDEYSVRDSRVVVIHQKNGGICNARNAALKIAKGEYIGFSDHDDEYLPGLLEDCFSKAKDSDADVVKFVKKEYILKDNRLVREKRDYLIDAIYTQQTIKDNFFELFDRGTFTCVWDGLIKRETLEQSGVLFDTTFKTGSEDIDFMIRLAPYIKQMVTMSKCYYYHYIRKGFSTSSKFNIGVVEAKKRLPQTLVNVCSEMGINVFEQKTSYSFYLMKEYFNYVFALYANPSCKMPFLNKLSLIQNLVKMPYVPDYFLHQPVGTIFRKSKKLGVAYFFYKYHLYFPLYMMYKIRLKLS